MLVPLLILFINTVGAQVTPEQNRHYYLLEKIEERRLIHKHNPLIQPTPLQQSLRALVDADLKDRKVSERIASLMKIDAQKACPEFKNPRLESREWIDIINNSLTIVNDKYSNILSENPEISLMLLRDAETMKQDASCILGPNTCRLKWKATLDLYTGTLSPDLPKFDDSGFYRKNLYISRPEKINLTYALALYKASMKIYLTKTSKNEPADLEKIFEEESLKAYFLTNSNEIPDDAQNLENTQVARAAYKQPLQDLQNILIEIKTDIDEDLGKVILPRLNSEKTYPVITTKKAKKDERKESKKLAGIKDVTDPCMDLFANESQDYSFNNYLNIQIPLPKSGKKSCVEKISLREVYKIPLNGRPEIDSFSDFDAITIRTLSLGYFEDVQRRGYKITGYQFLGCSSLRWQSLPLDQRTERNEYIAKSRADRSRDIVDKIPGFTGLDHVPEEKLKISKDEENNLPQIDTNLFCNENLRLVIEAKKADEPTCNGINGSPAPIKSQNPTSTQQ